MIPASSCPPSPSAGFRRGRSSTCWRGGNLVVSQALLTEYRAVPAELPAHQKITPVQWRALVAGIAAVGAVARIVVPRKSVELCRDPADDMLLDACLAARADVLVTGDGDLLSLGAKSLRSVGLATLRIVTPRAYLTGARARP